MASHMRTFLHHFRNASQAAAVVLPIQAGAARGAVAEPELTASIPSAVSQPSTPKKKTRKKCAIPQSPMSVVAAPQPRHHVVRPPIIDPRLLEVESELPQAVQGSHGEAPMSTPGPEQESSDTPVPVDDAPAPAHDATASANDAHVPADIAPADAPAPALASETGMITSAVRTHAEGVVPNGKTRQAPSAATKGRKRTAVRGTSGITLPTQEPYLNPDDLNLQSSIAQGRPRRDQPPPGRLNKEVLTLAEKKELAESKKRGGGGEGLDTPPGEPLAKKPRVKRTKKV
ncbi:hypothetical protein VTO73DRAFT_8071 [Trametes versicolor]